MLGSASRPQRIAICSACRKASPLWVGIPIYDRSGNLISGHSVDPDDCPHNAGIVSPGDYLDALRGSGFFDNHGTEDTSVSKCCRSTGHTP